MIPITKLTGRLGNQMFQFAYIFAHMKQGIVDDIYVQDPYYFDEFRNEIRQLYGDGIGKIDKVAIHVRRGDYVKNHFYVDLSKTDYYERAIAEFPGEKFLVFSDDIDFCKNYFIGDEYEFNDDNEVEAMNKMASCKGVIMANSSFSFWGAYLSNGKVVAPSKELWYSDGIERTKCPDSWLRL